MNSTKSENCVQLFKKLQIFGFNQQSRNSPDDSILLASNMNRKTILDGRLLLMKHILDSISALRYIHEKYSSVLEQDSPIHNVEVFAAKDCIFLKAVSLSLEGIFDSSIRDERVDILLNAFPGDDRDFLPLHWAMLAGASVADKTVEIIYNDNTLALHQYHHKTSVSWTAGHFLCARLLSWRSAYARIAHCVGEQLGLVRHWL